MLRSERVLRSNSSNRLGCARRGVDQQARALLSRLPDIVALQEVTPRSVAAWAEAMQAGGFPLWVA